MSTTPNGNFESPDHALISGMVMGLAWKFGLNLEPIFDKDGNYTNRYEIVSSDLPANVQVLINVEPPVLRLKKKKKGESA